MRSKAFATADLADADAIKTSIATAATAQSYSGVALNGAAASAGVAAPVHGFASYPTATASSSSGSYVNGSLVVFTGTYRGQPATSTATVVGANGNATFTGNAPLDTVTSIAVGAQVNTSGAWTFGFTDLVSTSRSPSARRSLLKRIVGAASGNVVVGYGLGSGALQDTIATTLAQVHDITPDRIFAAGTTAGFTAYI